MIRISANALGIYECIKCSKLPFIAWIGWKWFSQQRDFNECNENFYWPTFVHREPFKNFQISL